MANRYLIGTGARNWNDPLNWSETSGGAGGATVPTSGDAVILDANSGTGTVTLNADANCASFDASALGAATTIAGSVFLFNCYGSFTGNSFLTFTLTGTSYFYSRGTGTITQGGATLAWNQWYIDASGGTVTNEDDFTLNGLSNIKHTNGTWNTNDKTITASNYSTVSGTKTLTLGSSLMYVNEWYPHIAREGLTVNCGTSKIISTKTSNGIYFGGKTWYDIDCYSLGVSGIGCSCHDLRVRNTSYGSGMINAESSFTVSNNLILEGYNSSNSRLIVRSNTIGTPRTITCNGQVIASNVDFMDIIGAGSASWDLSAIPGGSGDCGGNSGITFTPAQPQYYKHSGGGTTLWSEATKWFTDQALTVAGRVPLPQDDANFIAGSFDTACTLSVNCPRIGRSLDMSGVDVAVTMRLANSIECYGSISIPEIMEISDVVNTLYIFKDPCVFDVKCQVGFHIFLNRKSNLVLNHNIYAPGKTIRGSPFSSYSFDFNDFDVTANSFAIHSWGDDFAIVRKLGNGTITVNNFFAYDPVTDFEGSRIIVLNTINSGIDGANLNILDLRNTTELRILTNNLNVRIIELILAPGKTYKFRGGETGQKYMVGKLTAIGTPEAPITITSTTTTPFNLVKTGAGLVNVSNCNISYCNATPNRFFAMDSVDGGNNTGWVFGQIGASPGEIGLSVIEDAEAEVIGEAIFSPNFSEMEELGCQVFADALVPGFELSEAESMDSDAFGEAVITPDFVESEIMDADLKATALASADFVEHEQAGDDHGVLRMFENILTDVTLDGRLLGETSFITEINSESEIL